MIFQLNLLLQFLLVLFRNLNTVVLNHTFFSHKLPHDDLQSHNRNLDQFSLKVEVVYRRNDSNHLKISKNDFHHIFQLILYILV